VTDPAQGSAGLRVARLSVLAAAVLWSTAGAAIKSSTLTAWQIAGGRALFAAIVLAVFLPEARLVRDRLTLAVAAVYAATTVSFVYANTKTTAANAIFLQDAAPLWILVLSPLLLREHPSRGELAIAPVYLAGTALFFVDELAPGGFVGNVVGVISGVCFALLIMGLRRLRTGGAEAAVLYGNLIAVLVCAPLAIRDLRPTALDVGIIAFLGVFQLGLSYVLFVRGLRRLSALEGSLLGLVEPVLNPIWAFAIAGERPGPFAIAGGTVILGATVYRVLRAPAPSPREPGDSPARPSS
jgi:drug/metabolite transporter (DMT)-like permease